MARLVLSRQDEVPFVPEAFRALPAGEQPTFRIASLTGAQRQRLQLKRSGATDTNHAPIAESLIEAAGLGLRGWSNVRDQDDKDVPWPGSGTKAVLLLPYDVAIVLGIEVVNRSELSEEQRGN